MGVFYGFDWYGQAWSAFLVGETFAKLQAVGLLRTEEVYAA